MISILACGNQANHPTNESTEQTTNSIPDAVSLLTTVWNSYQEEEKFSVIGGDFSEENQNMNDLENTVWKMVQPSIPHSGFQPIRLQRLMMLRHLCI